MLTLPQDPRTRVTLGLAAVVVTLLLVAASGLRSITRLIRSDAWVTRTEETRAGIREAIGLISDVEASHRGYLLTGDSGHLLPYQQARQRIDGKLAALHRLMADNEHHLQRMRTVLPLVRERLAYLDTMITVRDRHGVAAAAALMVRGEAIMDSLREQLDSMDRHERAQLGPRQERAEEGARRAASNVVTISLLGALIALVMARILHRDLTKRFQSEALYRSVVGVMAEGVVVQHGTGQVVDCNPAAERILGLKREYVLQLAQTEWHGVHEDGSTFPKKDHPALVALRTGEPQRNVVMGIQRKDGAVRWLLINSEPLKTRGAARAIGVVSTFSDITRRREAEAAARDGRERLQEFLDNASDLIVTTDVKGRILYANRAWRETLGYAEDADVLGRPLTRFADAPSDPVCRDGLRRILAGESLHDFEVTFVARDGRRIEVSGSSNCRFEQGQPVATRSIFRDVTELNVVHEQLMGAIEHADAANRAKSEFLANMSHELRTPLNSVIGFSNVLLRNKAAHFNEQDALYVRRILDNGRHLLGLINNILDLSKVEAGRMDLALGETDLAALVGETLAQMESQVQGRPVALRAELPTGLAPLTTDAGKLKQVLINLVANALRFTETGSVVVRVEADPAGRPLALAVQDSGVGISPERQAAVFEAFAQGDNTTSRRYGGTGLGLTISRSLCQLMGYEIGLTSEPGLGSTFSVRFLAQHGAVDVPAASVPAIQSGKPLVLIVDDDPDARLLLSQYVRDDGCEVIVAGSGEQGLRLARERRPDLILLDVLMPKMTGLEVLDCLRADETLRPIPVVIVSIVANEQRHRAVGAVALIDKPVEREEIEAVLRRYLAEPPLDKRGRLGELLAQTLSAAV